MLKIYTLKNEAKIEVYTFIDKQLRELPKNKDGSLNEFADGYSDNDVDALRHASAAAAKYLKTLDEMFSKKTNLGAGIKTIPVKSKKERAKFVIAAFNGGEGRIARAQNEAKKDGKDPSKWIDVKQYLRQAGATPKKVNEITEYTDTVLEYKDEFSKKSQADKYQKLKNLER